LLKISYKALLNKIKEYEIKDRYRELAREQMSGDRQAAGVGGQVSGGRVH
jgi:hypothetical protein